MTQAYTREDVARAVAKHFQVPKRQGQAVVSFVFEEILRAIKDGRKVNIAPVGSFRKVEKPARRGRNPSNGEVQEFPPKSTVRFKLSAKAEM